MAREKKYQWTARVTFVPFASEAQRDRAYRAWVRLFLRTREGALRPTRGEPTGEMVNRPIYSNMNKMEGQ